jgi:hypothetical protein
VGQRVPRRWTRSTSPPAATSPAGADPGHTNNAAFHALSGALDAAYDWFADPTLILGKGVVLARGMDAIDGSLQGVSKVGQFGPSAIAARGIDALRGGAQRAGPAGGR